MRARTTGGTAAAPADTSDYLNTSNADYSTGSDVTWSDSGADANVITMAIGTNSTAANKPSNLFGVKFFDTGATIADLPSLRVRWERVSSPESNETQWPVTVVGFICAPASTTPVFGTHSAFWIACKYAFTSNGNTNGHSVRSNDQTWSWTSVQLDSSAPTNYQCQQDLTVNVWQRMSNSSGTAGDIGVGYWLGTTNYPGSGGGGTNLYTTTKSGFTTITATDKIYMFVGAGAGASGGSGTRTVTGRVRYFVEK